MSTKKVVKPAAKAVAPATTQNYSGPAKAAAEAAAKKLELHKFYVGTEFGVRYMFKDGEPIREVACIHVQSDRDLANEPEEAKQALGQARCDLMDKGYCLNDYEANCEAELMVEESLGEWKHMVEYGKKCQKCTANFLEAMRKMMKLVREQRDLRIELNRCCDTIPEVIPEKWHVDGKKFVDDTEKPPMEVHVQKCDLKDAPKEVQNLVHQIQSTFGDQLKKLGADDLKKLGLGELKQIEVKKPTCGGKCKKPCNKALCPTKK